MIKQILENNPYDNHEFPQEVLFCEGIGEPIFRFTIEKIEKDHYIDEKGQKWVKA